MLPAADYSAARLTIDSVEVVRLADHGRRIEVSIAPSLGNNAYEMKVNGQPVFWSPYASPAGLKEKPAMLGNPFLAPWANRLDQDAFFANGKKYALNRELRNFRIDANDKPIHGLLVYSPHWRVVSAEADGSGARLTSRLEFWRHPDLMAQFPFAHTIEMTYRLADGDLEVETAIDNHAAETMPVSIGYHTYYQLTDSPRDEWRVHVAARKHILISKILVPTGQTEPLDLPEMVSLGSTKLDDLYTDLVRDAAGWAEFRLEGKRQRLSILYGPKYTVSIIYAPPGAGFICFEPMTGPTNAFNMAHAGVYGELQTIPPGGRWKESFRIRPAGF